MTSVAVQPFAGDIAKANYAATVEKLVPFSSYANLIPADDLSKLSSQYPSGLAAMWGVKAGKGPNVTQYRKLRVGHLVMFRGAGTFFACGTVACLLHNPDLAEALWGADPADGQTWEYMYALDEMRSLEVPYAEFNEMVGYGGLPRGFIVLDGAKSLAVLDRLPLASQRHVPLPSDQDFAAATALPPGDLDRDILVRRRTEQDYLRRMLFPGPDALCDLCGRRFDIEFLIAAHIKRRAACTDSERRDVSNIVISACRFGCDELFERGYITATADGAVLISQALRPGSQACAYASEHFADRILGIPMAGREAYFGWHRTHAFRG